MSKLEDVFATWQEVRLPEYYLELLCNDIEYISPDEFDNFFDLDPADYGNGQFTGVESFVYKRDGKEYRFAFSGHECVDSNVRTIYTPEELDAAAKKNPNYDSFVARFKSREF